MDQLFNKWNDMIADVQANGMPLLIVLGVVCLLAICALAIFARDDVKRSAHLQRIIGILAFVSVAACGAGLISWAAA